MKNFAIILVAAVVVIGFAPMSVVAADSDGDGLDDSTEASGDFDGDGDDNVDDTDSDNDGIADGVEGIGDSDGDGNPDYLDASGSNDLGDSVVIVCDDNGNPTNIGSLLSTILSTAVTIGALIGIVGGTLFTVLAAVSVGGSSDGDGYTTARNDSMKYGFGSLILLYALGQLSRTINEGLDFTCLLPGL